MPETWLPNADLRGERELPALIVAGIDEATTIAAIQTLAADLADAVVTVAQPPELDGTTGRVEDHTVALLNRGLPGSNVESSGSLYLSLMRSCSGWPSGVRNDPPRRTMPDGSNFQFQHWSHTFEYAMASSVGDWRAGRMVQKGHEFNNPLIVRTFEPHPGRSGAIGSFAQVEPSTAVVTVVKPHGNPMAHMAGTEVDAAAGISFRLYESSGRATRATLRSFVPLGDAYATNILEESNRPIDGASGDGVTIDLEPYATVTVTGTPDVSAVAPSEAETSDPADEFAPRTEPAQPVYADYWLHNKGAAPMGYQPVTVQIRPGLLTGDGPFTVPVQVASERTDGPFAGSVTMVAPPGWRAEPQERLFRLAPGGHTSFETTLSPPPGAASGRYFVAARIVDPAGQLHEDVVRIDLAPRGDGQVSQPDADQRSPETAAAIERAIARRGLTAAAEGSIVDTVEEPPEPTLELDVRLRTKDLRVRCGERDAIRISLVNEAASEIRGEAQLISPHETWPFTSPWTQGFSVDPGKEIDLVFAVHPPADIRGGEYWALVKVMAFGRIHYTEAVSITVEASARLAAETASGRRDSLTP